MKTLLRLTLWMCLAATALVAGAQDLKIGYLNSERVWREAAPAKAAQAKLEAEFSKREHDIEDLEARLKAASDKLEKDAPSLTESERNRRQRALLDDDHEAQRRRREFQEDLNQRKYEEQAALVERANKVIRQICEQEKYDLVVQEVVYANPKIDITDKVIKALNASNGH